MTEEGGWLKLHRSMRESLAWKCGTATSKQLMIELLMMVNFAPNEWTWMGTAYRCEPGEVITSVDKLQKLCSKGTSTWQVRHALTLLRDCGFLHTETTNKNTRVSICNWNKYQSETTSKPQANRKQTATIIERKEREERVRYLPGDEIPEEVKKKLTDSFQLPIEKFDLYHDQVQAWKGSDGVKDVIATIRVWMRRDLEEGKLKRQVVSVAGLGERVRL